TGPNAFSSSSQNPTIAGVILANAGVYSVTVTVSGCTSAAGNTTVVINPIPAAPTASNNGPLCEGATLNLTTPFVGGATYSWTGPNAFSSSSQNPTIAGVTSVNAGVYSVTVTVSGCTSAAGNTTVVIDPVPATPTASNNGPLCEGETLDLTTPFVAGATYSWTGPNAFSSSSQNPTIAGVILANAGVYSVTVTVSGCTSLAGSTTVTINPLPTIDSEAKTDVTSCVANDGTITITASGGTSPLQFSIDGGSTFTGSGIFTGLSAGSYLVVVSDANGCTVTGSILVITAPGAPAAPVAGTNATYCDGDLIDSLTATGTNIEWFSDPGLTVSIGTGSPFAISPGVGTTTYYVTQTVSGCQSPADSVVIVVNAAPSAPTAGTNATYCDGDPVADLTATGTNIEWFSDAGLTTLIGTGSPFAITPSVGTTTYYVIQTVSGCQSPASSVVITVNAIPSAPTAGTDTTYCEGDVIANLTASGSGGIFTWYDNAGLTNVVGTGVTFTPDSTAGNYTYYVTETAGTCEGQADSVFITINALPTAIIIPANPPPLCNGDTITLTASGGSSYLWNTSDVTPPITVTPSATTTYTVTVSNGTCSDVASVIVTVILPPVAGISGITTICNGQSTVLTASGAGTYLWSTGSTDTSITVSPLTDTTFYVSITNSCGSSVDSIAITVVSGVVAEFTADPSEGEAPLEVEFTDESTGAVDTWLWDFGDGTNTSTKQNPTHTYENEGQFDVVLIVTNSISGCTDEATISIIVIMNEVVFIPEVFSPNNDGVNDILFVRGKGIDWIFFRIYDRWGELVFESNNIDDGWDGKYKGKNQPTGTYTFVLIGVAVNNEKVIEKGNITLIR
ncbi:MAG: gliding motility-associated C-terminal domain-containing protein, partial [Bacteroidetes bacterium]|nr:gliding motility-associated C-terminal domain-containing protein [Bacteroidota bacterium]